MSNGQFCKSIGQYQIDLTSSLGKGSFGEVYIGKDTKTQEILAIKVTSLKGNEKQIDQTIKLCQNECQIMSRLNHPNLVKFYSFQRTQNNIYFMMEYCEGGTLNQYIDRKCNKSQLKYLAETEARIILSQIVNGYKEMYNQNIVHRDLKPSNILINKGVAKISDFGFSKILNDFDNQILMTFAGTPLYMSPQILTQQLSRQYSTKTDIWSLGIIFYEVLYGQIPWKASSIHELMMKIQSVPIKFPATPRVSDQMKQIISKMLIVDEKDRMSWDELFQLQIQQDQESLLNIGKSVIMINQEKDILKKKNLEKNLNRGVVQNIQHGRQQQEQIEKAYPKIDDYSNKSGTTQYTQSQDKSSVSPSRKEKIFSQKERSVSPVKTLANFNQNQLVLGKEQQQEIINNTIIKKISDWITYKKNKSEFLNKVSQQLFEQWSAAKFQLHQSIYLAICFLLTKYQVLILYKIYTRLQKKVLNNTTKKFTEKEWAIFCQSKDYPESLKMIQRDYSLIKEFLIELVKKTQAALSDTQIEEMKQIKSIANMEQVEKKKFDYIFQTGLQYYLKIVLDQLHQEQNDRGFLEFAVRLKDCCRIHDIINFQELDFFKYEDDITNSSKQQLLEQLLK
ncbi:unnamed protein product (macronuclear) [Paramecium tetraurelia]|uniref:Protein kinase domain-containing protein n=1 Tax=Paramecium tetraurelia TaxID=5888 RepID=A0ECR0_PARTE|nr:uncharacterized protein GSPATT00003946001 [Paramecium tetraurelia]CAK93077.1 unnamed protein product [Paramecium tetraurelia]|eukprot:XP_001460474.1 hypothetical protein (macronuclear) [Paramecium tetraurelia strain d4-2]